MSIAKQISQGVADALIKLGIKPATQTNPAPEASALAAAAEATGAITEEVRQAITSAVESAVGPIKTQLTKAQEDLTAANKLAGEKDTQISTLKAELNTATEKAAAAEKQTNETKAGVKTEVAKGVATVAAEQGLPAALPIKTAAQNPANPEIKTELKGLAKVTAAIKAEISKK